MKIQGHFYDVSNNRIEVIFENTNIEENDKVIGENGLFFGGNPVSINFSIDDSFETIIRKSCTITLVTNSFLGNYLFAGNSRSVSVKVKRNENVIFDGFVEPSTFNQPYVKGLDEFEINCIDFLSTLQYYNYKNGNINTYDSLKSSAETVTLYSVLETLIPLENAFYDCSKGVTEGNENTLFEDIKLSEFIFYGEDKDDLYTQEDVLNEILKYLNLHIIQEGDKYFIFDWDKLKSGNKTYYNLVDGSTINFGSNVTITKDSFAADDTSISMADVYNQIGVSCKMDMQDDLIDSPLDSDSLSSLYNGKQKYMTEYISEGSGDDSHSAFQKIVKNQTTDYESAKTTDWYFQVMKNDNWKLNIGNNQTVEDLCEQDENDTYINQYKIPQYLKKNSCTPALLRFGEITTDGGTVKDNSPKSKVDMKDYLFISVNGNENDTENNHYPTDNLLQEKAPILEYVNNKGGVFSPADSKTTNYLVFSGRIILQPIQYESGRVLANRNNNYQDIYDNGLTKYEGSTATVPEYYESQEISNNLVRSDNNQEGRYYTRKFYNTAQVTADSTTYMNDVSLQPWTKDKSAHGYTYRYSKIGDSTDTFTKLPILECELIIGDKRCIETNIDSQGNSTFEWVTVGEEPIIDGQPKTTFSLGVNPKIGDKIIGDEYEIQNTIKYQQNVDAEGTAIPITADDNINGKVTFRILGTINSLWNSIYVSRHPSFWRHTEWADEYHFILAHTENVIIKEFNCKVETDNGMNNGENLNTEIIYKSAESDEFVNSKDNIEFNIFTQLTTDECFIKGITTAPAINSALLSNNKPLRSIYCNNEDGKPEEHYIDSYYREYSKPRTILECTLHNNNFNISTLFNWQTLNNSNFVLNGIEENVKYNNATVTLKEYD